MGEKDETKERQRLMMPYHEHPPVGDDRLPGGEENANFSELYTDIGEIHV